MLFFHATTINNLLIKKQTSKHNKKLHNFNSNQIIAERFIGGLINKHRNIIHINRRRNLVSTSFRFLNLKTPYSFFFVAKKEKSLIERKMQYIKDRTENFDNYFPCRVKSCKLKHVLNWLQLFVDYHNKEIKPVNEQSRLKGLILLSCCLFFSLLFHGCQHSVIRGG